MKIKYTCSSCKHENIIDVTDIFTMGFGREGISSTEVGLGGVFSSSDLLSGFGGFPGRAQANTTSHRCVKCNELNIIER